MSKKYYLALDDYEHSLLIHALNDKRNELIKNGKYTDAVDEVLVKSLKHQKRKCNGFTVKKRWVSINGYSPFFSSKKPYIPRPNST